MAPKPTDKCYRCGCLYTEHVIVNKRCQHCGSACSEFITLEHMDYLRFLQFYKWAKKWLKLHRGKGKRLRAIHIVLQSLEYFNYCNKCKASIIFNNGSSRAYTKHADGLQCISCKLCRDCCDCRKCSHCHVAKRAGKFCKTIESDGLNHCLECCKCKYCDVCAIQCGGDWCEMCHNCNSHCPCPDAERILWYSSKPIFHECDRTQMRYNPISRFMAAEIEIAHLYGNGRPIYDVVKRWGGSIVKDGSLTAGGFEINTAPSGGDVFIKQIEEVCNVLRAQSAMVDNKCGLHIHLDARDFTYYDIRKFVRVYAAIEILLFNMVPKERMMSKYCRPCGDKYLRAVEAGKLPYEKVKNDIINGVYDDITTEKHRRRKYDDARYVALNIHSWFYRGTLESRIFNGTINSHDIIIWSMMWALIMEYVLCHTDEEIGEALNNKSYMLLKTIIGVKHKKVIDFINERILKYGTSAWVEEVKNSI